MHARCGASLALACGAQCGPEEVDFGAGAKPFGYSSSALLTQLEWRRFLRPRQMDACALFGAAARFHERDHVALERRHRRHIPVH